MYLLQGLDPINPGTSLKPLNPEITAPRIDRYRFSMANLEDSQDVDLDAILGELCALETVCDQEINQAKSNKHNMSKYMYIINQIHIDSQCPRSIKMKRHILCRYVVTSLSCHLNSLDCCNVQHSAVLEYHDFSRSF